MADGVLDIIGSTEATTQGTRLTWQRSGGQAETMHYRGPSAAVKVIYEAFKTAAQIDPTIIVLDFDPGKGLGDLIIQKAEEGALANTSVENGVTKLYEMLPNEFTKRPEQCPSLSLTSAQIKQAYDAYDNQITSADSGFTGDQKTLLELIEKGEEFMASGYVLRETKVCTGSNAVQAEFGNINRVVNPPYNAAANVLIGSLPDGEWLKRAPTVRQITTLKWHIQTEWWWANAWSAAMYGGSAVP